MDIEEILEDLGYLEDELGSDNDEYIGIADDVHTCIVNLRQAHVDLKATLNNTLTQ